MAYRLQWTERKKEDDYETGFGIGPRFHPRFNNAKVVNKTDRTITFERIVLGSDVLACQVHHLRSWDGHFDIKTEKIARKADSDTLRAGCPVCLQEVGTYINEGILKIENHTYRDSELQCPGSGDALEMR